MPAGRPRKPDTLKALEGNPGKRDLNARAPIAAGEITKPDHITGYAEEVWHQVLESMPPQLYGSCDSQLLAAYCAAADLLKTAIENRETATATDLNKWATIQCKATTALASAGAKLGLDPSTRSGMVLPSAPEKGSKFAGLIPMTAGRNG